MAKPKPKRPDGKCSAKTQSGKPCGRYAILGANVCPKHGGAAKQVKEAARKRLELAMITPERTLLELARIAYSDVASFFDKDGHVLSPADLDEDQRAVLAGFEACVENVKTGDNKQDWIHKFKAWDKVRALEILAKYFGHAKTPDPAERAPVVINAQSVHIAQLMTPQELLLLRERIRERSGSANKPRDDRGSAPVSTRK